METDLPRFTRANTALAMTCSVEVDIRATPDVVWRLLTDARGFPRWNPTVTAIDGEIRDGQRITLHVPGTQQKFTPTVSVVVPGRRMIWGNGFEPVFKGVRTYTLEPGPDGSTRFAMSERFSGVMFALTKGMLPDFGPVFESFASGLKREAERLAAERAAPGAAPVPVEVGHA